MTVSYEGLRRIQAERDYNFSGNPDSRRVFRSCSDRVAHCKVMRVGLFRSSSDTG